MSSSVISLHPSLSAPLESLAEDYWDAVETGAKEPLVEYGSDLDTLKYCSGFSKKRPNSSGIEGAEYKTHIQNNAKQGEAVKKELKKEIKDEEKEVKGEGSDEKDEKECSTAPSPSDGMFSEAYYERTGWNLNNLAASQGSVLKYLQVSRSCTLSNCSLVSQ